MAERVPDARRTVAALALLGFSSGLPYLLSSLTVQAWTTSDGVDITTVGLLALTTLPYSLKFLVAPLVDRFALPWLGRRRGWILVAQLACAAAIAAIAACDPTSSLRRLALVATLVAATSALQDVVVDACRADSLSERDAGFGVAVFLAGYRGGVWMVKGVAFVVVGALVARTAWPTFSVDAAWRATYLALAALMAIGIAGTLLVREPPRPAAAPATLAQAVKLPFIDIVRRYGVGGSAWMLLLCVLYRLPDALTAGMTVPFLIRAGVGVATIGVVNGVAGIPVTIAGSLVGAVVLRRASMRAALAWFAGLQAIACASYAALALLIGSPTLVALMPPVVLVEDFCGGLATAAFVAYVTTRCSAAYSATQYALLTSVVAFGRTLLVAPAGAMAQHYGWPVFFAVAAASAIPGLLLVARCVPRPATAAAPS